MQDEELGWEKVGESVMALVRRTSQGNLVFVAVIACKFLGSQPPRLLRRCQASRYTPDLLMYCAPAHRDNKQIVMQAIEYNGRSLEHASTKLKGDPEVSAVV